MIAAFLNQSQTRKKQLIWTEPAAAGTELFCRRFRSVLKTVPRYLELVTISQSQSCQNKSAKSLFI